MAASTVREETRGFVYVATGEGYFRETAVAVGYLRASNPGARVCVVTDKLHPVEKFWDDIVVLERPAYSFRDKLMMVRCPYDRFVYLDCDTYVAGDLSEMFTLLDQFDAAGHQLFEGHDYRIPEVPDAFPEFNGGVFAFRRTPAVEQFFARWLEIFAGYSALNTGGHYHYTNVSDQKAFRVALYQSGLRHTVLAPEFDFIVQHVQFACGEVKVFHGRPWSELQRIERLVNARLGMRAWVPILDACLSQNLPPGVWAKAAWGAALQALRGAGRAVLPAGLKDRFREVPLLRRLFLRNIEPSKPTAEQQRKWKA
jgi:hypothetical protein